MSEAETSICRCGRTRKVLVSGPTNPKPNARYAVCECDNKFEWLDDRGVQQMSAGGPDCKCGKASVQRAQKKEGANKGRKLWCCAKTHSDPTRCKFFEWQDAAAPPRPAPKPQSQPLPGYANHLCDCSEMQRLEIMLATDPKNLSSRDYDTLKVVAAWKITNPVKKEAYERGLERVRTELCEGPSTGLTGMPPAFLEASDALAGGDSLCKLSGECFLLHGTRPESLHDILFGGLDKTFAHDGGLFGRGLYAAEDAGKIDQYTTADDRYAREGDPLRDLHQKIYAKGVAHPKRVRYVLVCRVVLGTPARTKDGRTRLDAADEPLFTSEKRDELRPGDHSVIAEGRTFREFVVFNNDQIHVEYLVAYQRTRTLCDCGKPAKKRTVVKEGPNKGRQMLLCDADDTENKCKFFTMYPHCDCRGQPATKKTSNSSANPGREYWGCGSRPRQGQCKFFEWCDGQFGSASPAKKARTS